jgi:hypothetical protein
LGDITTPTTGMLLNSRIAHATWFFNNFAEQVASVLAVPIRYLSVPLLKLKCAAWLALCSL